ncbi:MAG: MOSC N-terminal beta barrel domain-containing protein [Planctomycetota bacterium]
MPVLDRITIYPVKSLDGLELATASVLPCGAIENDRRWRLVDMEQRVVNAKRMPLVHALRADFHLDEAGCVQGIELAVDPAAIACASPSLQARLRQLEPATFPLLPGPQGPCAWLSEALGLEVLLEERGDGGFPDDRDAPGATLIATATLEAVGRWFGLSLKESRRRFRANLEVGGCDPFWEDTLASPAGNPWPPVLQECAGGPMADPYADLPPPEPLAFAIGGARLRATNVCRRCAVPTRDSRSGAVSEYFREAFEARRRASLREDVAASGWNTLYRLAINTVGSCTHPAAIQIGDAIVVARHDRHDR